MCQEYCNNQCSTCDPETVCIRCASWGATVPQAYRKLFQNGAFVNSFPTLSLQNPEQQYDSALSLQGHDEQYINQASVLPYVFALAPSNLTAGHNLKEFQESLPVHHQISTSASNFELGASGEYLTAAYALTDATGYSAFLPKYNLHHYDQMPSNPLHILGTVPVDIYDGSQLAQQHSEIDLPRYYAGTCLELQGSFATSLASGIPAEQHHTRAHYNNPLQSQSALPVQGSLNLSSMNRSYGSPTEVQTVSYSRAPQLQFFPSEHSRTVVTPATINPALLRHHEDSYDTSQTTHTTFALDQPTQQSAVSGTQPSLVQEDNSSRKEEDHTLVRTGPPGPQDWNEKPAPPHVHCSENNQRVLNPKEARHTDEILLTEEAREKDKLAEEKPSPKKSPSQEKTYLNSPKRKLEPLKLEGKVEIPEGLERANWCRCGEHRNDNVLDKIIKSCRICRLSRACISLMTHFFGKTLADKTRKDSAKTLRWKRAVEQEFRVLFVSSNTLDSGMTLLRAFLTEYHCLQLRQVLDHFGNEILFDLSFKWIR